MNLFIAVWFACCGGKWQWTDFTSDPSQSPTHEYISVFSPPYVLFSNWKTPMELAPRCSGRSAAGITDQASLISADTFHMETAVRKTAHHTVNTAESWRICSSAGDFQSFRASCFCQQQDWSHAGFRLWITLNKRDITCSSGRSGAARTTRPQINHTSVS